MSLCVVYETEDGFGSLGWLVELKDDTVHVADPVLGEIEVLYDELVHLFDPETGSINGFRRAALVEPTFELQAANPDDQLVSGYPLAWERVRKWREGAAIDWRTVALVGVFCLTTVQRPIEVAEEAYRTFGPVLLRALEEGRPPNAQQVEIMLRAASVGGLERNLSRNIVGMIDYAPWLTEQLQTSRDYTRGFRNRVALKQVPRGLSLAKLSFLVSILGRDAACFDARLYTAFFKGDREEITRVQKSVQKSAKGTVTELALQRYKKLEDKLKRTPFYDKDWPMPYAQAQWRMWESLGTEPAEHGSLWAVVPEPELDEAPSAEIRRIKNRLLRNDER